MNNEKHQQNPKQTQKSFTRKREDLELKNRLIAGPELFIVEKGSDDYLDKLALTIKLRGGDEFLLSEYVAEVMAEYEPKFSKQWFYRLADLYSVNRSLMDAYVKPEFVRKFIIQFVYGRFHYMVLRTLRSKNRRTSTDEKRTKLFQHLTKKASEQLDIVIEQVYAMMSSCQTPLEFKMKYSNEYSIYFQLELF